MNVSKSKDNNYLTEEQARHVYKKVESGSIINTDTLCQEIEQEQELNRIDDTSRDINPYKELIVKNGRTPYMKEEERDMLELDFDHTPDKLKEVYLNVYKGIYSEILSTTGFDENSDLSTTYLGKVDKSKKNKIKA